MAHLDTELERKKGTVRGRESRNLTLTTKLTAAEFAQAEAASKLSGKTAGEWLRDLALAAVRGGVSGEQHGLILAEVIGVRLLLVNVLRSLAAGQTISPEAFDRMLDEIANVKYSLAEKLAAEGRK